MKLRMWFPLGVFLVGLVLISCGKDESAQAPAATESPKISPEIDHTQAVSDKLDALFKNKVSGGLESVMYLESDAPSLNDHQTRYRLYKAKLAEIETEHQRLHTDLVKAETDEQREKILADAQAFVAKGEIKKLEQDVRALQLEVRSSSRGVEIRDEHLIAP